jgi:hypothetical protein
MDIFKRLLSVFSVPILTCLIGCGTDSVINSDDSFSGGTSAVLFKIAAAPNTPFARIADSASLTISAPDMNNYISPLIVTDSTVEGTITGIPAGKNRLFTVSVFDSLDSLQYKGSATVNLPRGATVNVPITLYRVGANAIINGSIVECGISDLVGYYPFNGNANIQGGTLNNGLSYGQIVGVADRFGVANHASSFSADADSIVVNFAATTFSSISFSLWYYTAAPVNYYPGIIYIRSKAEDANKAPLNASFSLGVMGNAPQWISGGKTGRIQTANYHNGFSAESNAKPAYNKWHHVIYTYDKTTKKSCVYINGVLDSTGIGTSSDFSGADMLKIGSLNSFNNTYDDTQKKFVGYLDDVYLFNRALTEAEVLVLFHENGWSGN